MNARPEPSRRTVLQASAVAVTGTALAASILRAEQPAEKLARKGRINQSLVNWCYEKHFKDLDAFCAAAARLGCKSIELIGREVAPRVRGAITD